MSKWRKNTSKREVSSCSSSSTCSSDHENDSVTLKPIKDYLSNKIELSRQLFRSVKAEKIRMMLPQILKSIDMTELEELCANELCGMSKSRILSIINGTPITISSNTSDSNDSGPSLEIISDTEIWMSDNEHQNYSSFSNTRDKLKANKKSKSQILHNGISNVKSKSRSKIQTYNHNESDSITVKKEKERNQVKDQEGESLLDLLELEMRARAIKALIRKEEDIVLKLECDKKITSNANIFKEDNSSKMDSDGKLLMNNAIVESFNQNTIDSVRETESKTNVCAQMKTSDIDEDQDVVMLVNPTPMINLLSTDSDSDTPNKCTIGKLVKKRSSNKSGKSINGSETEAIIETSTKPIMTATSCNNPDIIKKSNTNCSIIDNIDVSQSTRNIIMEIKSDENKKIQIKNRDTCKLKVNPKIVKIEKQNHELVIDDNKLVDEEIIDLDVYPDMEDIDNCDHVPCQNEISIDKNNTIINDAREKSENIALNLAETWATRYYQTDSVQNVIKESKIQSEIRKRLRERQKLSKLNINSKNVQFSSGESNKEIEPVSNHLKLTGSVQEYLALETTTNVAHITNILPKTSKPLDIAGSIKE
ncbi:hypothetical protein PV327_002904 [Microctonus hyperodae]|uniref:Uncharacterized protein n=1 Tax=Microctonus hyperodae TaxID=165561 RepID=A0AA39FGZ5_MICHY|nr:hypothetical protein PV327_002904 [Microctonus hyperodae]